MALFANHNGSVQLFADEALCGTMRFSTVRTIYVLMSVMVTKYPYVIEALFLRVLSDVFVNRG